MNPKNPHDNDDEEGEAASALYTLENESGLAKLLNRLQQLEQEYQKRRSVSEKRYNYRVEAIKERYKAEIIHNRNESISETAENSVALIHKYKTKDNLTSNSSNSHLSSSSEVMKNGNGSSSSVIAARKRSLPAINQLTAVCPPALKMARRQSVAAYPQASSINIINPSIQTGLIIPKSAIDADLLAIKSRISKALKR